MGGRQCSHPQALAQRAIASVIASVIASAARVTSVIAGVDHVFGRQAARMPPYPARTDARATSPFSGISGAFEPVANVADGLDVTGMPGIGLDFRAEGRDASIHAAVIDHDLVS